MTKIREEDRICILAMITETKAEAIKKVEEEKINIILRLMKKMMKKQDWEEKICQTVILM